MGTSKKMASRRPITLLLLLFVLLVGTASPAFAYNGSVSSPDAGLVSQDTSVQVKITRQCFTLVCESVPRAGDVELQFGTKSKTLSRRDLECLSNCSSGSGLTSTWGGITLKPTGKPLEVTCNGWYWIRALLDGDPITSYTNISFQQPPAAVTGLSASGEVGNVQVSWNAASDPDLVGIGISRKASGAATFTPLLAEPLAPGATSFVDTTVTAADLPVTYAVTVFRHDGRAGGDWAEACKDSSTTLEESFNAGLYAVATAEGQVVAPTPTPTGSPTPSENPSGPNPEPTAPASPRPPPDRGLAGGDQNNNDNDPPDQPSIDLPDRPAPQAPQPRYYGDNLGFDELLDFGDTPPITAPTTPGDDMAFDSGDGIAVDVDAASEGGIDTQALLEPFALGLLLLSLAMHVRRWMNA